jgi:hypothetical protein
MILLMKRCSYLHFECSVFNKYLSNPSFVFKSS